VGNFVSPDSSLAKQNNSLIVRGLTLLAPRLKYAVSASQKAAYGQYKQDTDAVASSVNGQSAWIPRRSRRPRIRVATPAQQTPKGQGPGFSKLIAKHSQKGGRSV